MSFPMLRLFAFAVFVASILYTSSAFADWVGQPFTLRTPAGKKISLADYRGKILVLEFFASWCPSCHDAVPELNELAKKYPGKLEVLAVSTAEEDPFGLDVFIEETNPQYPIVMDTTDQVARQYRVLMFPTYFVLNGEGGVESFHRGPVNWKSAKVQKYIDGLVNPAPAATTEATRVPSATLSPAAETLSPSAPAGGTDATSASALSPLGAP